MSLEVIKTPTLDILPQSRPSLSSTSDMPIPVSEPARSATSDAPTLPALPEPAPDVDIAAIDARADKLAHDLDRAIGVVDNLAATPEPRPARHDFRDSESYDLALINWSGKQEARKIAAAKAKQQREERASEAQRETNRRIADDWNTKRAAAIKEYPDYTAVAERADVQIDEPTAQAILAAQNGPSVAYHLGRHPEEAARIAKLPPGRQIFEVGQLSAKLAAAKPVRSPSAPGKPSGSREESMTEYAERRNKEMAAERRGRLFGQRAKAS